MIKITVLLLNIIFEMYYFFKIYYIIFRILPVRLIKLSELIVDLFPTEIKETYYIPYSYDKANKVKILPKRKLFSKYKNLYRARLLASGVVGKKTLSKRK